MPNHVRNILNFYGPKESITEVLKEIQNENGNIDFEKIIPMPANIYRGDLGIEEMEKYKGNNWYDWSITHWGTKWNAYDQYTDGSDIEFSTAWSVPEPIYEAINEICIKINAKYPDRQRVTFLANFCDEDYGSGNCGHIVGAADSGVGILWAETEREMEKFYERCWGWDPSEDYDEDEDKEN